MLTAHPHLDLLTCPAPAQRPETGALALKAQWAEEG